MMPLFLLDALEAVGNFFESGGFVLYLIALLTFVMWVLMLERLSYFNLSYRKEAKAILNVWESRSERKSWDALAIRDKLISETYIKIDQNLALINTLIAVCPLFGLLGTVTGMIDVFTVLSLTGGSDAKLMAGGVSKATIPTMAGMVAALSGVFGNIYITRKASRERESIEEQLTMDH
jgi:biopolymer transport protein ExbB